jgi:hypothetical protein
MSVIPQVDFPQVQQCSGAARRSGSPAAIRRGSPAATRRGSLAGAMLVQPHEPTTRWLGVGRGGRV